MSAWPENGDSYLRANWGAVKLVQMRRELGVPVSLIRYHARDLGLPALRSGRRSSILGNDEIVTQRRNRRFSDALLAQLLRHHDISEVIEVRTQE